MTRIAHWGPQLYLHQYLYTPPFQTWIYRYLVMFIVTIVCAQHGKCKINVFYYPKVNFCRGLQLYHLVVDTMAHTEDPTQAM